MKVGQQLAGAKSGRFEREALPCREMVLIPGGTFRMGSDRHYPEEAPDWLPVDKRPFTLLLRLYWPKTEFLAGSWTPPAVVRVN